MRIAFGFDIFYPETNGVITATINLAKNLIQMGHEVYFFVPADKDFKDDLIENGIHIIHVKALPTFIYKGIKVLPVQGWYLQRYFRKYKFDIVHNTSPWLVGQALNHAARRMHTPVLATHHTLIDNPIYIKYALKSKTLAYAARKPIWTIVFHPFFRLVWMVTAPNKETCENVKAHVPNLDVRYVSNGIDVSRFDDLNNERPLPPSVPQDWINRNTFVYVGRLGYEKAIDVVIDAMAYVIKTHPEAKLLIIGQGPAEEDLKDTISKLGLQDNICMTGMIPNQVLIGSKLLKKVNSFVTASLSENQAMTVIEALCSGTPVICADVYNMTTLVSPEAGWYFTPSESKSLADTMCHVLENPEERDQKAIEAKKNILRFDGRAVARQFVEIYNELLEMKENNFYVAKGKKKADYYGRIYAKQDGNEKKKADREIKS